MWYAESITDRLRMFLWLLRQSTTLTRGEYTRVTYCALSILPTHAAREYYKMSVCRTKHIGGQQKLPTLDRMTSFRAAFILTSGDFLCDTMWPIEDQRWDLMSRCLQRALPQYNYISRRLVHFCAEIPPRTRHLLFWISVRMKPPVFLKLLLT
jgi:hypothetical protein